MEKREFVRAINSLAKERQIYYETDRLTKRSTADCPGGIGHFGFNSYDLLTMAVLGFRLVSLKDEARRLKRLC